MVSRQQRLAPACLRFAIRGPQTETRTPWTSSSNWRANAGGGDPVGLTQVGDDGTYQVVVLGSQTVKVQ